MSAGAHKKNGADRHGIGGNLGPRYVPDADPGLGFDFVDNGPVAISAKVSPAHRERFYAAIRSQGPEEVETVDGKLPMKVRRRAIDMATERARRDKRLSGTAFRFFHAVASRSKWKHRYFWQSTEMLAFISAQNPEHSNAARYVDQLVDAGYLQDIYVPSETGGRHKRYLTVVCTAADRTGQTLNDIASEARQHKVRGAEENQDEIAANDDRTSNPQPREVNGTAIRNSDALPCNSGEAIRNPDALPHDSGEATRNPDVSMRNPDALTLDTPFTNARGEGGGARPHHASQSEHSPPLHESTPLAPPAECDLQLNGQGTRGAGIEDARLGEGVYAIHRSWRPGLADADADHLLNTHLAAVKGSSPAARLERIILSLEDEHALGRVTHPGTLVERRIEQANARARAVHADAAATTAPFKSRDDLGVVGFGDRVTGAEAMDILAAVPGADPGIVRRLIREVCGAWTGPNGRTKSRKHVVDEVIRQLRAPDAAGQTEIPSETIVVGKPTSAKEDGARFAALRKQMTSTRPPACAKDTTTTPQRGSH